MLLRLEGRGAAARARSVILAYCLTPLGVSKLMSYLKKSLVELKTTNLSGQGTWVIFQTCLIYMVSPSKGMFNYA